MQEMIYHYDGSFEGFLCCIYESYANKEVPTAIDCDGDCMDSLFSSRDILSDHSHALRVYRKLRQLSPEGAFFLRRGFLTCLPEKEMHLYRFIRRLLRDGPCFLRDPSDDTAYPIRRAVRHLQAEVEKYRGFVRFSELQGGTLGSEIEPKNRVLPVLKSHFCTRFQNETFFIYDITHQEALFYTNGTARLFHLESFQMAAPDAEEQAYRKLWKSFYDTIAIRERENPRGRMTHMPKHYWSHLTEMQPLSLNAPSADAAVEAPSAPDGISAPAIPEGSAPPAAVSSL